MEDCPAGGESCLDVSLSEQEGESSSTPSQVCVQLNVVLFHQRRPKAIDKSPLVDVGRSAWRRLDRRALLIRGLGVCVSKF